MVPNGWEVKELQFLCNKIAVGLAISVTPFMRTSGVKLIRNQNIKRNYFNSDSVVYIDEVFANSNKSKKVRHGDVVAVRTGSNIGEACVVPKDFDGALTFTTLIARPNPDLLDSFYLSTHINSDRGISEVNRLCAGGGKPNLNSGELKRYRLLTPPLPEQKKIAQILSTWDKAIASTEQLLTNSQQQKKALMQQLLTGKKRLLDKNGVRFSGEWIHGRLGDLCTFKGGSAFKEVYQGQTAGEFPFIKVSDMNLPGNERSIEYSNNWVSVETAKLMKAKPFPESSIVFAKVGAALLLNRRRILSRPTIIDNNMMAAIPSNVADTEFLYQLLMAIDFARFVQEGAVPSINQGDLSSFKLSYPDVEEQQKIAAALSNADQEIALLQQKLEALKQEKKALMQQLLTGKRRVKVGGVTNG
ncbi:MULTISPECIES: restriction endonuclease subunit S [Shewanella]|uniref:restriction endonuclease subunit S n=1 Tax=Shewanella TaxID=22 RepID=UPI00118740A5|nr:restriction endonuclease subunit S [Shewanella algae]EKT4487126.1 restriction endonuclease subunit S [Shewanella algae]MBO2548016.1 restriction endonuclease subunit S [Shewanella algae]TVP02539.1 restriction endonuclease subunit S [Shewanella algae]